MQAVYSELENSSPNPFSKEIDRNCRFEPRSFEKFDRDKKRKEMGQTGDEGIICASSNTIERDRNSNIVNESDSICRGIFQM